MQEKVRNAVTMEKRILGYRISDLLGIAIMLIPFFISIFFNKENPAQGFLFFRKPATNTNIQPSLIPTLCSVVFYAALVVRYEGIFKANNLFEAMVSSARAFLNCWVIAALIGIVFQKSTTISANSSTWSVFFKNSGSTLLVFAILFSWLGMKSIAGYSWILFIAAAWKNLLVVNSAMGMIGAIFILTLAISLFLQIKNYSMIKDFIQDFRTRATKYQSEIRDDINQAADDVVSTINDIGEIVKTGVAAYTGDQLSFVSGGTAMSKSARIDLNALDVNKDGVVDEKDFIMLYQNKDREEQ